MTAPAESPASVTYCNGNVENLPAERLGFIGFGDAEGCNPCNGPCNYVPVEAVTWSRLKTLVR